MPVGALTRGSLDLLPSGCRSPPVYPKIALVAQRSIVSSFIPFRLRKNAPTFGPKMYDPS